MKRLKFYKEADNRWYVELPEWQGSKADLEMVAGADTMLEYMAEDKDHVFLYLSETEFVGADKLDLVCLAADLGNGAYYRMEMYNGIELNLEMWLCDVTKFVFGDFPKIIFISTSVFGL
jgi:hypothetical protein